MFENDFIECVLKWIHSLFDCWFGQLNEDWNVGSRCKRVVVDGLILMVMEKKREDKNNWFCLDHLL